MIPSSDFAKHLNAWFTLFSISFDFLRHQAELNLDFVT